MAPALLAGMDKLFIVSALLTVVSVTQLIPPTPTGPLPASLEAVLHPPRASLEAAPACLDPLALR